MKKIIIISILAFMGTVANAQVAVIANKSVPANTINKSKLLDVYSLTAKNWENGNKIVAFDIKGDTDSKSKFYGFIGKSNSDLKKVWMKAQLTGEGFAPEALSSDEEVVKKVSSTPGAIGYVGKDAVNASVKVLAEIN